MLLLLLPPLLLLLLGSEEVGSFQNSSGGRSHTLLGGFPAVQWVARRGRRGPLASIPLKSSMAVGSPNALAGHWDPKGAFYPFQSIGPLFPQCPGRALEEQRAPWVPSLLKRHDPLFP